LFNSDSSRVVPKYFRAGAEILFEELPFRDESFDAVFHVGGINFFTDKSKAMAVMVRVAKPGTKIVIAFETEKAIQANRHAIGIVFGKDLIKKMLDFSQSDVLNSVPKDVCDVVFDEIWEGNGYLLTFRKPGRNNAG
jgi:SAM-dependent methyltransferase